MTELCVVFDIDDTLYLERDYVISGLRAAGEWARSWAGIGDFGERCIAAFEEGRRGRIFDDALAASGIEPKPGLVSTLVTIYRSHMPDIRLCGDAASALESIRGHCPVAVVTDGPAISQSRKAQALGLGRFASPIYLTELLGPECCKPSTAAFEAVQRAHAARRYVYVADNPVKDFQGPARLGWTTVRVRRPGGLHAGVENGGARPDFEFTDCGELVKVLGTGEGAGGR